MATVEASRITSLFGERRADVMRAGLWCRAWAGGRKSLSYRTEINDHNAPHKRAPENRDTVR